VADLIGGYSTIPDSTSRLGSVGAVIGATAPNEGRRLRQLLPRTIILAPGLGAQGGDPASIHSLRGTIPGDLLVPVSRGLSRVEDRGISASDYRQLMLSRIEGFKAEIVFDYTDIRTRLG